MSSTLMKFWKNSFSTSCVKPIRMGFGLALGLLVIEMQRNFIAGLSIRQSCHDDGRHQDFETDLVGQHEQPIAFLFDNFALNVSDHGYPNPVFLFRLRNPENSPAAPPMDWRPRPVPSGESPPQRNRPMIANPNASEAWWGRMGAG